MSETTSQPRDLEVPEPDAFEQSLPVGDQPIDEPMEVLAGEALSADLEVPENDAIEQHQPATPYEEDGWR